MSSKPNDQSNARNSNATPERTTPAKRRLEEDVQFLSSQPVKRRRGSVHPTQVQPQMQPLQPQQTEEHQQPPVQPQQPQQTNQPQQPDQPQQPERPQQLERPQQAQCFQHYQHHPLMPSVVSANHAPEPRTSTDRPYSVSAGPPMKAAQAEADANARGVSLPAPSNLQYFSFMQPAVGASIQHPHSSPMLSPKQLPLSMPSRQEASQPAMENLVGPDFFNPAKFQYIDRQWGLSNWTSQHVPMDPQTAMNQPMLLPPVTFQAHEQLTGVIQNLDQSSSAPVNEPDMRRTTAEAANCHVDTMPPAPVNEQCQEDQSKAVKKTPEPAKAAPPPAVPKSPSAQEQVRPEAQIQSHPKTQSQAKTQCGPKPQSLPETQTPQLKTQTPRPSSTQTQPQTQPQSQIESQSQAHVQPQGLAQFQSQTQPQPQPQSRPQAQQTHMHPQLGEQSSKTTTISQAAPAKPPCLACEQMRQQAILNKTNGFQVGQYPQLQPHWHGSSMHMPYSPLMSSGLSPGPYLHPNHPQQRSQQGYPPMTGYAMKQAAVPAPASKVPTADMIGNFVPAGGAYSNGAPSYAPSYAPMAAGMGASQIARQAYAAQTPVSTSTMPPRPTHLPSPSTIPANMPASPSSSSTIPQNRAPTPTPTPTLKTKPAPKPSARKAPYSLIVDVAETCEESFPFEEVAARHSVPRHKVVEAFSAIIQLPLLRCTTDKRRHGKLATTRMREFAKAKKDLDAANGTKDGGTPATKPAAKGAAADATPGRPILPGLMELARSMPPMDFPGSENFLQHGSGFTGPW